MFKKYVIFETSITPIIAGNLNSNPPVSAAAAIQATGATFQINNAELTVPVVTLSMNENIKF